MQICSDPQISIGESYTVIDAVGEEKREEEEHIVGSHFDFEEFDIIWIFKKLIWKGI
jgi:hypothetical protein